MGYWRTFYHLIWGTKGRAPIIDAEREALIQKAVRSSCMRQDSIVNAFGVMPDHVHLAVSIPPTIAISDFVRIVKGSSSHLVNQTIERSQQEQFAWQAEFGVLTFGERSLDEIREYIDNQRTHHAENALWRSFELVSVFKPSPEPTHSPNGTS